MRQDGGSRGQGTGRQDGNPSDKGDSQGGPRDREVASSGSPGGARGSEGEAPAGARGSEGEAPLKDTAQKRLCGNGVEGFSFIISL